MSAAFQVVIPARLGSTRLPRKVLRDIGGRPLVQYTWDAARKSGAESVIIATDDQEVRDACLKFGADVRMTAITHNSGTDRVNEIAHGVGWSDATVVVNLQGDEPLMPAALIRQAAELLQGDAAAHIATLCHPLQSVEEWLNPNIVKLVMDQQHHARYFSRAPIPWQREGATREKPQLPAGLAFRHIGIYAYRVAALRRFSELPSGVLENCEALEQLRALENGLCIRVGITDNPPPRGVDTEDDLKVVTALLTGR
jgi:3-deoxy-manno-octulosonate cytidylyltransferase (CMP-KDO synthetase)